MTVTYGFYNSVSNDRQYDAIEMSRLFDGIILDGVYAALGDYFLVTESAVPAMSVVVGTGRAWFNHTWTYNDADITLTVSTADALLPRIDVVYLEVNEDAGVRANKIDILDGTPASSPVAPTLTNTTTVHQYPLAHIYVAAAVTSIIQANITNKIGTTATPFVTCPLTYITTNDLLAQWESEWEQWFNDIKDQLSTEAETNLQAQIWDLAGVPSGAPPYATDMVSLNSHDHDGSPGLQIPTAGIENLAITEPKMATGSVINRVLGANAVTSDKILNGTIGVSDISTALAGNGLSGGGGSALAVRVDDATIQISSDVLRIKDLGITAGKLAYDSISKSQLANRNRYIWIPAGHMIPNSATPGMSTENGGVYLSFADGVVQWAGTHILKPVNYLSGDLTLTIYWWCTAGHPGAVAWGANARWVKAGDDLSDGFDDGFDYNANSTGNNYLMGHAVGTINAPGSYDEVLWINFYRYGMSGGDTLASYARMIGVMVGYTADS